MRCRPPLHPTRVLQKLSLVDVRLESRACCPFLRTRLCLKPHRYIITLLDDPTPTSFTALDPRPCLDLCENTTASFDLRAHRSMSSSLHIIDYGLVDEEQLPYENPRFLGSGNSGAVVHAVNHRDTKALYAQKKLRISLQPHGNKQETFLNEVSIIRGLANHRHIVRVHATYLSTLYFGILLEPVASDGDLEAYLAEYVRQRDGNIAPDTVTEMKAVLQRGFGCLAAGLAFMHKKRVRHKDIKPRNILVHHGVLLYTDFGYSWDSSRLDTSMTDGRASGNTPMFSAPETLNDKERNSKSDVFSLGCVFIHILSALSPALIFDFDKKISDILDDVHDKLGSITLSPELAVLSKIITRMTEREVSSRLCSAHAACHLLQQSNFCCAQCASSENRSWAERGRDDNCAPPAAIALSATIDLSHEISGLSIDSVASPSANAGLCPPSSLQAQGASSSFTLEHINVRNRDGRLGPGYETAQSPRTLAPSQINIGYKIRTGAEAAEFFRQGRVFSVRQSEVVPSRTFSRDAVSVDRGLNPAWGAQGFQSVARRFVVVKTNKKQQCSYACEISTYGNLGTLASNCNASEHAVVHVKGTGPVQLPGEREKGLRKEPIAIELEDQTIRYEPTSRLNFGRENIFPWTALVQLHGSVIQENMSRLIGYYREEHNDGFERNDD